MPARVQVDARCGGQGLSCGRRQQRIEGEDGTLGDRAILARYILVELVKLHTAKGEEISCTRVGAVDGLSKRPGQHDSAIRESYKLCLGSLQTHTSNLLLSIRMIKKEKAPRMKDQLHIQTENRKCNRFKGKI